MRKLSKNEWIATIVAVVFVAYAFFGSTIIGLFKDNTMNGENSATASNAANIGNANGGLIINDVKIGTGREAQQGNVVVAHYVLTLQDGTVIQNSKDFGQPFQFVLGAGQVIKGWEQGFEGMKVGGVRVIVIPPDLGYGANQAGPIPPNSTLVFSVELVDVKDLPTSGVELQ